MSERKQAWLVRLTCAAVVVAATWITSLSSGAVGIARDEDVYMTFGSRYADWWLRAARFEGVSEAGITAAFGGKGATDNNREHPPLMKTLSGLAEHALHDRWRVMDETRAYRLPSALANAVLIAVVFAWTRRLWGWPEAIVAAACTFFLPRAFFHAQLACFDAAIASLWFLTIYAYWRGQLRSDIPGVEPRPLASPAWSWGAGICFGLALATKHNALILPFPICAHAAWVAAHRARSASAATVSHAPASALRRVLAGAGSLVRATGRGLWREKPWAIISMATLGPLLLVALWPWLWFDTVAHVRDWIGFHLTHVHYNFEYLGDNWNAPPFPWHVPLVTTALTVPVATLAAGAIGVAVGIVACRRRPSAPDHNVQPASGSTTGHAPALLALSAAAAIGPFILGSTPIFGAEKHWAAAIPSLCMAAGVGACWAGRRLGNAVVTLSSRLQTRRRLVTEAVACVVGAAVVIASVRETQASHPYGLSHYNALAGGAPGGADLGMNRQFWGVAARGVLGFLSKQAPGPGQPPAFVYTHDASPAWRRYIAEGLLPPTLPDAGSEFAGGIDRSRWAFVVHEKHFARHDYLIWKSYGTVAPAFVLRVDGVPLVSVYRRP